MSRYALGKEAVQQGSYAKRLLLALSHATYPLFVYHNVLR